MRIVDADVAALNDQIAELEKQLARPFEFDCYGITNMIGTRTLLDTEFLAATATPWRGLAPPATSQAPPSSRQHRATPGNASATCAA